MTSLALYDAVAEPAAGEWTEAALVPSFAALPALSGAAAGLLLRMFADPRSLEPVECQGLLGELRHAVERAPEMPELRVLLGMALCVGLDPEAALDELRLAVNLDPGYFLAQFKLGELCMRLRIVEEAAAATAAAAGLARHPAQRELARRQAATIRGMQRHGVLRRALTFGSKPWLPQAFRRRQLAPGAVREEGRPCLRS